MSPEWPECLKDISFLESISLPLVLCIYNNKGYGPKWFSKKLSRSSARLPVFKNIDDMKVLFKTIILQEIAIKKAIK